MEIILLGVGATLAMLGGGFAIGFVRKGRAHRAWQAALQEASERLPGARASAGTRYDGPELRAEIDGQAVRLRVVGERDSGRATARVALGEAAPASRLWLGWDVPEAPSDWAHVPEVGVAAARVEGTVVARSDDAAFADRALEGAYLDLVDARREARAHGVVLSVRGGYLELELRGIETSPHLLERSVHAAARVAAGVPRWAEATGLSAGGAQEPGGR